MSRHDFRCALSGVSLLDAEAALLLVERREARWRLASLPLWGTYDGSGTLAELQEGPGSELLLEGWLREQGRGSVTVDFESMELSERPMDSLEMVLSLMACSQVGGLDAVRVGPNPVGFVLLSAHVAAHLMELEPELDRGVKLEGLADVAFEGGWGSRLYAPLSQLPLIVRCKFGISLAGLISLRRRFESLKIEPSPTSEGIAESESEPARYLAEAMVKFESDEVLLSALEDYAGQLGEEPALD
jgi:hypothetical protein